MFEDVNLCAIHAKRVTLMAKDVQLWRTIANPFMMRRTKSKKRSAASAFSTAEGRQKKEIKLEETKIKKEDGVEKFILGAIRLEDSESEKDKNPETQKNLRAKLTKAQQKLIVITFTIEQIHRIIESLIGRLREATKLIKTAAKKNTFAKSDQADKLLAFAKENKIVVNRILEPLNLGV